MSPWEIAALGAILGGLAFFEPCAIASNLLFTQYLRRVSSRERAIELLRMTAVRAGLLISLGFGVSALAGAGLISFPASALPWIYALFGAVYVVSRFVYLPVPNFKFFAVVPGAEGRLSKGTQIGLTLPACTLPLAGALLMALAKAANPLLGSAVMALFAALFSAPAFIYSRRSATPGMLRFLDRSARATPYLTGALFAAVSAGMMLAD